MPSDGEFRLGVTLSPYYTAAGGLGIVRQARLAEQLGFDDVWVPDHLTFRMPIGDIQVMASMTAAATERIQVCLGVLQAGMRHPLFTAKWIGALALEAPGRVLAGLGVGGDYRPEWQALGVDPASRGRRFDEVLGVLPRLLANESVAHRGDFYTFDTRPLFGSAPQKVPLWIGARDPKAIRRALSADGWYGMVLRPDEFHRQWKVLHEQAAVVNRPPPRAGTAVVASVLGTDSEARNRCAEYFRSVYGLPADRGGRRAVGGVEAVRDLIDGYRAAGADRVSVMIIDPPESAWPILASACLV